MLAPPPFLPSPRPIKYACSRTSTYCARALSCAAPAAADNRGVQPCTPVSPPACYPSAALPALRAAALVPGPQPQCSPNSAKHCHGGAGVELLPALPPLSAWCSSLHVSHSLRELRPGRPEQRNRLLLCAEERRGRVTGTWSWQSVCPAPAPTPAEDPRHGGRGPGESVVQAARGCRRGSNANCARLARH